MYDIYLHLMRFVIADYVNYFESIYGATDSTIAYRLHCKFGYIFPELTYFDWVQLLAEFRSRQKGERATCTNVG